MITEVDGGREEWVDYVTEGAWSSTRTGGEGVQPGDGGLWAIAGTAAYGGRSRLIRMVTPGGRHRGVVGTLFCSVDARSSTENSVVVTTLYSLILTFACELVPPGRAMQP